MTEYHKGYQDGYKDCKAEMNEKSVLDKIRAEIEEYQKDAFYSDDVMMSKKMVLDIIDKYR